MQGASNRKISPKLTFRERFAQNPIDKHLNKVSLLKAILDKKQSKELLRSLDKYHDETNQSIKAFNKDNIKYDTDLYIKKLIDNSKTKTHLDLQFKKILKQYAIRGKIPSHYRKEIWMIASGASLNMAKNPGYYAYLKSNQIAYPANFLHSIELDLKRTFPDKPWYENNDPYVQKMRDVLSSYAKRNPTIGYCQGLNFIIAKILKIVPNEEEAFWLLTSVIETYVPTDYFTNMEGVLVDQQIFQNMIAIFYPDLIPKFNDLQIDSSLFSLQWFVCLYTSILPDSLLFSLWDLLILDGTRTLFKAGIFLVGKLKSHMKMAKEFHEIFLIIDEKSKQLSSSDLLEFFQRLETIYINKDLLKFLRELHRIVVRNKIKELEIKKVKKDIPKLSKDINNEPKDCLTTWPICIESLHINPNTKPDKTRSKSMFICRVNHITQHIIINYFNTDHSNQQAIKTTRSYSSLGNNGMNIPSSSIFQQKQTPYFPQSPLDSRRSSTSIVSSSSSYSTNVMLDSTMIMTMNNMMMNIMGDNNNNNYHHQQQERVLIGRQMHTCKQSEREMEENRKSIEEKAIEEKLMFKAIEDTCKFVTHKPTIKRSTTSKLIHGKVIHALLTPRKKKDQLIVDSTPSSSTKLQSNNSEDSFKQQSSMNHADQIRKSSTTQVDKDASFNSMNNSYYNYRNSEDAPKPTLMKDMYNIKSNVTQKSIKILDDDNTAIFKPSKTINTIDEFSSEDDVKIVSSQANSTKKTEDLEKDPDSDSSLSEESSADDIEILNQQDNMKKATYTRSIYDILEEVNQNKDKLVDKIMELNKSILHNSPSIKTP